MKADIDMQQLVAQVVQAMQGGQAQPVTAPVTAPAAGNLGLPAYLTPPGQAAGLPLPIGWSVSLEIPVNTPEGPGKASADLAFSLESWSDHQAIIHGLIQQGYPVRVYRPKPQWGGQPGYGGGGYRQDGYGSRYGGPGPTHYNGPPPYQGGYRRY